MHPKLKKREAYCETVGPGVTFPEHTVAAIPALVNSSIFGVMKTEVNPNSEPDVHGGRRGRVVAGDATAPLRCTCGGFIRLRSYVTAVPRLILATDAEPVTGSPS